MLENGYWVAGIVVAVVAVIGLFIKLKRDNSSKNEQNASVNGESNTVNQNASVTQQANDEA